MQIDSARIVALYQQNTVEVTCFNSARDIISITKFADWESALTFVWLYSGLKLSSMGWDDYSKSALYVR